MPVLQGLAPQRAKWYSVDLGYHIYGFCMFRSSTAEKSSYELTKKMGKGDGSGYTFFRGACFRYTRYLWKYRSAEQNILCFCRVDTHPFARDILDKLLPNCGRSSRTPSRRCYELKESKQARPEYKNLAQRAPFLDASHPIVCCSTRTLGLCIFGNWFRQQGTKKVPVDCSRRLLWF